MKVAAVLNQQSYRGRNDDGSEAAASWKAAVNTAWNQPVNVNFRVRFLIQETAGGTSNNYQPQLQYNRNALGWNNVNGASSVARSSASPSFAEGDNTTQQIGAGTFITPNSGMDETDGIAGQANNIDFAGNDEVEVEYCLQIRSADVNDGDTVEFRVITIDTYTNIASITVQVPTERYATRLVTRSPGGARHQPGYAYQYRTFPPPVQENVNLRKLRTTTAGRVREQVSPQLLPLRRPDPVPEDFPERLRVRQTGAERRRWFPRARLWALLAPPAPPPGGGLLPLLKGRGIGRSLRRLRQRVQSSTVSPGPSLAAQLKRIAGWFRNFMKIG